MVKSTDFDSETVEEPTAEVTTVAVVEEEETGWPEYKAADVHAALKSAGFNVYDQDEVKDGRLGPSTRQAIVEFQISLGRGGMNALGDLDPETAAALFAKD